MARTRLALAAIAADAVMCLFFASMWITFWAKAASDFGLIACGKGCRVVAVASEVYRVGSCSFFAFLGPVAVLLFLNRPARSPTATETETEEAPAPKTIPEALWLVLRRNPILLGAHGSVTFLMLTALGDAAERNWPHMERIFSLISAVGALGTDAMFCFLIIPNVTRLMWMTMK